MSWVVWLNRQLAFWPFPRGRANLAVDAGDRYRDRHEWARAAALYRSALRIEPSRRPIWVQLGHALKEDGRLDEALEAYETASQLPGNDGDAPAQLGALAKRMGDIPGARAAFARSVREQPANADGRRQLLEILTHPLAMSDEGRGRAKLLIEAEQQRMAGTLGHADQRNMVIYDASDLVSYFRHSRLPTGIQRVQMEVIVSALQTDPRTQICCFSDEKGRLARLPAALFAELVKLAVASGDLLAPEWMEAMETLGAVIDQGDEIMLARQAFLVNLGTSWWLQNYFLHIRAAQRDYGIRYVPFVHDFIPVMAPQHCVRELTQDFLSWTFGVFGHARFFLANSQSTKTDLQAVASLLGYDISDRQVAVVRLDADFRRQSQDALSPQELTRWSIVPGGYVLFVSTIESRKNHVMAFQAWLALIERHGADAVPDLVCVGSRGWLNDRVYAMLAEHPALAAKVRMLSHLSDRELALLYRNCCFTIYPSSYEGWGLPVTEALCYGKVPLLTRISSLPEAGGDVAVYVEVGDIDGFTHEVERLWFDMAWRQMLEQRIVQEFRPRDWEDIANQIRDELQHFTRMAGDDDDTPPLPVVAYDRLYRMERNRLARLVRLANQGDILRHGTGWWQPEDWGCWSKADGGELMFNLPPGMEQAMVCLDLHAPPGTQAGNVVIEGGSGPRHVTMEPASRQWFCIRVRAERGVVRIAVRGDVVHDNSTVSHYRDMRRIAVGLACVVVVPVQPCPSLLELAGRVAATSLGSFGLLHDAATMLHVSEPTGSILTDMLHALETGTITAMEVIAALAVDSQASILDLP